MNNRKSRLIENNNDKTKFIPQRDKLKNNIIIRERNDLTERQKCIIEAALDKDTRCIFIDGVWGSGKSYMCILAALKLLNSKRISDIIFLRNPVEASTTGKIGYLKGDISEKMAPYNAILYDKLDELLSKVDIDKLQKEQRISCLPLGFARGRSWNCKVLIVDECSSLTYDDFLLLLSRCGEFTRIFFIGDSLNQNDIGNKSGFTKIFGQFNDIESKENGIYCFELKEKNDIVRSGFVRFVMMKTGVIKN